jgi:6-phosphofructokinase 1
VDLGRAIKDELKRRLAINNIAVKLIDRAIGYEVRSAPPVPFDCEYTRDLGYAAIRFLANGGSGAMICIRAGKMLPIPFPNIIGGRSKTRVRYVDITTESYEVARKYMIRLNAKDFADKKCLASLAKRGGYTVPAFVKKFAHCVRGFPHELRCSLPPANHAVAGPAATEVRLTAGNG